MPASKPTRRAYKPRPVGRPVLDRMRNELILPAYMAIETLCKSDDQQACKSALDTLAACVNYMAAALDRDGRPVHPMGAAMYAITECRERAERAGAYRFSGRELVYVREAITHADEVLPLLRTHHLTAGMLRVLSAMDKIEGEA